MSTFERRLSRIEEEFNRVVEAATPVELNPIERRHQERWEALCLLLPEEDAVILAEWHSVQHPYTDPRPALDVHFSAVVGEHFSGAPTFPVAWPAEVAAIYRMDSDAKPLADCEDCGYPLPVHHPGWGNYPPRGVDYFTVCPVCGGKAGRSAYSAKHGWRQPAENLL